jgi:hypothetical protein
MEMDMFDPETETLPDGRPRCRHRWHALDAPEDLGGTVEWARCANAATARILVTENRPPYGQYESAVCDACLRRATEPADDLDKELFGPNGEHAVAVLGRL